MPIVDLQKVFIKYLMAFLNHDKLGSSEIRSQLCDVYLILQSLADRQCWFQFKFDNPMIFLVKKENEKKNFGLDKTR